MSWRWTQEFPSTHWEKTWSLVDEEGYGILSCDGDGNAPQRPADKTLIAAAPRLAEALKDLLKLHDSGVFIANAWNAAMEDARAALREAGVDDA